MRVDQSAPSYNNSRQAVHIVVRSEESEKDEDAPRWQM